MTAQFIPAPALTTASTPSHSHSHSPPHSHSHSNAPSPPQHAKAPFLHSHGNGPLHSHEAMENVGSSPFLLLVVDVEAVIVVEWMGAGREGH